MTYCPITLTCVTYLSLNLDLDISRFSSGIDLADRGLRPSTSILVSGRSGTRVMRLIYLVKIPQHLSNNKKLQKQIISTLETKIRTTILLKTKCYRLVVLNLCSQKSLGLEDHHRPNGNERKGPITFD